MTKHDLQAITDLCLIVFVTALNASMLSWSWSRAVVGGSSNGAFVLFFMAMLVVIIVSVAMSLYWQSRPTHSHAYQFIQDEGIALSKGVGVIAVEKTGLTERSSFFSRNVAVPAGIKDFSVPELFLKEEIIHEIG
ncbi:MAG: hypothetical protein HRU11_13835, partial [Parvularculaceae bacterium]|nr:hypothetical protein [Parvularculaceae bacterium]